VNWGNIDGQYSYLFLKSNYDGAYWVYRKNNSRYDLFDLFELARKQYAGEDYLDMGTETETEQNMGESSVMTQFGYLERSNNGNLHNFLEKR